MRQFLKFEEKKKSFYFQKHSKKTNKKYGEITHIYKQELIDIFQQIINVNI